jgi:phage recombination protein Bet
MTELTTTPPKPSALAVMATRFNVEPAKLLENLKQTVFKGASDAELMTLCIVASEYGLNPFLKEIYAFPAKGGGIVPVVSVDGWIHLMNSNPLFDGIKFNTTEEGGKPISCTAVIGVKGRSMPVEVTEYFAECFRATEPWKTAPFRMLRHKALIQGARVAFGLSGIMDEEDAARAAKPVAGSVIDIMPTRPAPAPAFEVAEPAEVAE